MFFVVSSILHCDNCKRSVNPEQSFNTIEEVYAANILNLKVCKCCAAEYNSYKEYRSSLDAKEQFEQKLQKYCNHYDYLLTSLDDSSFEIKTKLEKWIVKLLNVNQHGSYTVTLYHKNSMWRLKSSNKCGFSEYPDYHVQFTKSKITPYELVYYAMKHETKKWGVKINTAVQEIKI